MASFEEQRIISAIRDSDTADIGASDFDYKAVFLNRIQPDSQNVRYLPSILISDQDANLFVKRRLTKLQLVRKYKAEGQVLVGKACFINCLQYGTTDFKRVNATIESIIDLAHNIQVSEVIQAPTIYPLEDGTFYRVLTGHRRFFAMIYTYGYDGVAQFKVYKEEPLLKKTRQFQENSSREDLSQYGKLVSFVSAKSELDTLSKAKNIVGGKRLTVRETVSMMGISAGAYDNYNVLTRYAAVVRAYENELHWPFTKVKKVILELEAKYRQQFDKDKLNIEDRRTINETLKGIFEGNDKNQKSVKHFRVRPIANANILKRLLSCNVFELGLGIDWDSVDWQDTKLVNELIADVISHLENEFDEDGETYISHD